MGNLQSEATWGPLQEPLLQQSSSHTTPTRLGWKVKINNQQTVILKNVSILFDQLRKKEIPTLKVTMLTIFNVFKRYLIPWNALLGWVNPSQMCGPVRLQI